MLKLRLPPLLHCLDAPLREPNDAVEDLPKLRQAAHDGGEGCEMMFLAQYHWFFKNFISILVYFLAFVHRA